MSAGSTTAGTAAPRWSRHLDLRAYATAVGLACAALGVGGLAGWAVGASVVRIGPGGGGILPASAAVLVLAGSSLALRAAAGPAHVARRIAANVLALLVVSCGLALVAALALDVDPMLGSRLFPAAGASPLPGPNSAVAYLLAGLALLALDAPAIGRVRVSELLALGLAAIALLAFFGHVYGAASLYQTTRSFRTVGMSNAAAIAYFVLATGIFCVPSSSGWIATIASPHAGGRMARRILGALVALPLVGLVVTLGRAAGLYTQPEAAGIFAVLAMLLALGWIAATARALDRADLERLCAEHEAARWRVAVEHARWGSAMIGADGRIERVNEAFARQHGFRPEEMIGMPIAALVPTERRRADAAGPRSVHLRRDGSRFPALVESVDLRDEGGAVTGHAIQVQDCTDAERAERHRARLVALVGSSDDAIIATTKDGVVLDWNAGAERLYGYRAAEILGRRGMVLVPPERIEEATRAMARLTRGERIAPFETERLHKDGTRVPVWIAASPIVDERGSVLGFSSIARDLSERRRMQDALARTESRYRSLFESASDPIFVADLDGRYTEVNQAACSMLGYAREELVGKTIVDLIPAEDAPRLEQSRAAMLSAGGRHLSEWSLRRSDGTFLPVEVSARILDDGRWLGFVRDIRDRKRIEAELLRARDAELVHSREIEMVMHAAGVIAEQIPGVTISGVEAVLHTIAEQARALVRADLVAVAVGSDPERPYDAWAGLGPDGPLEAPPRAGMPPEHPDVHAMLGVPIRNGARAVGMLFVARSGPGAVLTDSDQRVIEMLASRAGPAIETALAYAGEALQRAWLRAAIEHMPEGVIIFDERGRIAVENPASLRLTHPSDTLDQWGSVDEQGRPVRHDIRDPTGAPLPIEELPLVRAFERGESVFGMELAVCAPGGELVPVLASARPVRVGDRPGGAVLVFQDIRTLKELERLREEWSSMIAHDLRQPLNVISMSAGILRRRRGEELGDDAKLVDRVIAATRSIQRMVGDLLDASRIEAHRLTLLRADHEITHVVRDVLDRNASLVDGRELELACGGPMTVSIDAGRIEQVLVNLVSNAVKYGEPGAPIAVSVATEGTAAEISVQNRGRGVPPDELPSLFRRFTRTRGAKAGPVEGIGLGLYICRGIVEAHGGTISAESVPGETTTFRFTLPRADPAAPAA